ncbi:MAG: histidinol dehydrogenase [Planctomycetes bacterium]|nr:histidinol dehydrogenase [Planctomycetota bacterium]
MLPRIRSTNSHFYSDIKQYLERLSPDGSVVSKKSRDLTLKLFGTVLTPQQVVERICDDVRKRGITGVLHYLRTLDNPEADANSIRVPVDRIREAHHRASPEFLRCIRTIRDNVTRFQTAILHRDVDVESSAGTRMRHRYVPLRRVGLCIPGGAAAYPSTVLMTAIPALCAGVKEIVAVSPPTKFGAFNDDVLATCFELGIQDVYAVGGAQGVAALAYGIEGIEPVDKIVGPGNLFVALAKKLVYGTVDIDSIAGPSEVTVITDHTTRPAFAASDLIAQAEHSPGASIVLSISEAMLDAIDSAIETQLQGLERSELATDSLKNFGASIFCRDEEEMIAVANTLAPEHLQISVDEPERFANAIRNAGAQFLGHYTPVALGDYAAGPSHVLPTGATARWASGLTSNDFLRSFSSVQFSLEALQAIGPTVSELANREGLTAHRESVSVRLRNN